VVWGELAVGGSGGGSEDGRDLGWRPRNPVVEGQGKKEANKQASKQRHTTNTTTTTTGFYKGLLRFPPMHTMRHTTRFLPNDSNARWLTRPGR